MHAMLMAKYFIYLTNMGCYISLLAKYNFMLFLWNFLIFQNMVS
jgi:hypothetical protein